MYRIHYDWREGYDFFTRRKPTLREACSLINLQVPVIHNVHERDCRITINKIKVTDLDEPSDCKVKALHERGLANLQSKEKSNEKPSSNRIHRSHSRLSCRFDG